MTKVSDRELTAIRMVFQLLKDTGIKVGVGADGKITTEEDLFGLAAGMLTYVLDKNMTKAQLRKKIEAALNTIDSTLDPTQRH